MGAPVSSGRGRSQPGSDQLHALGQLSCPPNVLQPAKLGAQALNLPHDRLNHLAFLRAAPSQVVRREILGQQSRQLLVGEVQVGVGVEPTPKPARLGGGEDEVFGLSEPFGKLLT